MRITEDVCSEVLNVQMVMVEGRTGDMDAKIVGKFSSVIANRYDYIRSIKAHKKRAGTY